MTIVAGDAVLSPVIWATGAVTILSGLDYVYRGAVELISRSRNTSPA